jgi:hypothetical protein
MNSIPARIKEFCDKQELLRIGYEDGQGQLHLVPVWFVDVDGFYCFGTDTKTLKSRSLVRRPKAGWVIDGGENRKYKGATFSGRAELIGDSALRAKVYQALGKKYFGSVDHPEFIELYGDQDDRTTTYFKLNPESQSSWEY